MEGISVDLKRINELIKKLENGELELEELMDLTDAARSIYEKSLLIKYKAFEKRSTNTTSDQVVMTEESSFSAEPIEEPRKDDEEEEIDLSTEQAFDFGMFEPTESEEENLAFEITEDEPVSEAKENEPEFEEHLSVTEKEEHNGIPAKEVTVTHTKTTFYDQLKRSDDSLAARIAGGKIETLIGAFGLNQRLQFINELFDGSSETFSDAIKKLDSQSDLDHAMNEINQYAHQFGWDPEEETVLEFIGFVNRRYA